MTQILVALKPLEYGDKDGAKGYVYKVDIEDGSGRQVYGDQLGVLEVKRSTTNTLAVQFGKDLLGTGTLIKSIKDYRERGARYILEKMGLATYVSYQNYENIVNRKQGDPETEELVIARGHIFKRDPEVALRGIEG